MDDLVRKITPMMVLPDIVPVTEQYRALGAEVLDSGDPGCVGIRAGNSQMILITVALMKRYLRPTTVAPLVGATVPYIFVRSLTEAKARLKSSAQVVEEALSPDGTMEAVVVQHGQFLVLAEQLQ